MMIMITNLDINSGMVSCGGDHDEDACDDHDDYDDDYDDDDDDYDDQPGSQQWNGQL